MTIHEKPPQEKAEAEAKPEQANEQNDSKKEGFFENKWVWQRKIGPAFWTVASAISLVVNIILIAILLGAGLRLFTIKGLVTDQLVGGLHANFIKMDEAHIVTTITVSDTIQVVDTIPVNFDLPIQKDTVVTLVEDTAVDNALVYLNGVPVTTDIVLKEGTTLNINLDLLVEVREDVPVTLNVPVNLQVPVDIPLAETDLHDAFTGLRQVVAPYYNILSGLPGSWRETPFCGPDGGMLCSWLEKRAR